MTPDAVSGPSVARGVDLRLTGIRKAYGDVLAVRGVSLEVRSGQMVSLVGPSGCGKTTTLRVIAGLERADAGTVSAGSRTLSDGSRTVPPESRNMGMVFQSYALWPHMTVRANIAYGLIRRKWARDEIASKVNAVLSMVGMAELADRYPSQLSGGQQQRVALARSVANEPGILLFDEPLSNLDAVLREQMRFEIRSLQRRLGITGVYVTHSQDEALVLSDAVAVMRDGQIVQFGPPQEIYDVPRTAFVATFIGLANILVLSDASFAHGGLEGRLANGGQLVARRGSLKPAAPDVTVAIRPADIRIAAAAATQTPTGEFNTLEGVVQSVSFSGAIFDYFVRLAGAGDLVMRVQATPPLLAHEGDKVALQFPTHRTVALEE